MIGLVGAVDRRERMKRGTLSVLVATGASMGLAPVALADYTNNILITGYWPQTNNMLRPFSTNSAQNPDGWVGENWQGQGWDIHGYFPEFPGGPISPGFWGKGEGDFEVDYQDTHADWNRIIGEIQPAAIITFSRGRAGSNWEIEGRLRWWSPNQWLNDYEGVLKPTADMAIFDDLTPLEFYDSALPVDDILQAVADTGAVDSVFIDQAGGGRFLSEFIGMHGMWNHLMNEGEDSVARSFAAGHIHVGIDTPLAAAEIATEATLMALTNHLNEIVPAPGSALLLAGGLAGLSARRRR